jgi:hypothetical protein
MECSIGEVELARRFCLRGSLSAQEAQRTLELLAQISQRMASRYCQSLPLYQTLVNSTESGVVLLTRFDLVKWLAPYVSLDEVRRDCLSKFRPDLAQRHEVIEADFLSVRFEDRFQSVAEGKVAGWQINPAKTAEKTGTAQQLIAVIDRLVAQQRPAPLSLSPVIVDYFSESRLGLANWRVTCEAPFVFVSVILLAWLFTGFEGAAVGRYLLGGACLVLARWFYLLAFGPAPCWTIGGKNPNPTQAVTLLTAGTPLSATVGELRAKTTFLSRLFDVGFVGYQGRWAAVPEFRRFRGLTGIESGMNPGLTLVHAVPVVALLATFFVVAAILIHQ